MKTKRVAILCIFTIIILSVFSVSVSATGVAIQPRNNHYDIAFSTANVAGVYLSNEALKQDSSGTYVHFKSGTAAKAKFTVYSGSGVNCTTPNAYISRGTERVISQYVYEWGYNTARLGIYSYQNTSGSAKGVWSPDSIGDFPYAN